MWKGIVVFVFIGSTLMYWFYPVEFTRCDGFFLCYGSVVPYSKQEIWLDAKNSRIEVRQQLEKLCFGKLKRTGYIYDACPGDWGIWFNARPIDLESILVRCDKDQKLIWGMNSV